MNARTNVEAVAHFLKAGLGKRPVEDLRHRRINQLGRTQFIRHSSHSRTRIPNKVSAARTNDGERRKKTNQDAATLADAAEEALHGVLVRVIGGEGEGFAAG